MFLPWLRAPLLRPNKSILFQQNIIHQYSKSFQHSIKMNKLIMSGAKMTIQSIYAAKVTCIDFPFMRMIESSRDMQHSKD